MGRVLLPMKANMNYRNYNPYKSCFPLNHDTAHCWATLKVESCTRDHISVQKLFSTFSAYYWNVYIFWICCCWENCHTLLKIAFFFLFIFFVHTMFWNSGSKNNFVACSQIRYFCFFGGFFLFPFFLKSFFLQSRALLEVHAWEICIHCPKIYCRMALAEISIFGEN